MEYGGPPGLGPPATEDEDNIVAALKHSDRVRTIGLTITGSLLQKFFFFFGFHYSAPWGA